LKNTLNKLGYLANHKQWNLLVIFCSFAIITKGQSNYPSLNIGDYAQPLRVRAWLKGTPVDSFRKGTVYIVEFWATWCGPCIAEMPGLSVVARNYKKTVIVTGVNVMERDTSIKRLAAFVDSMGTAMDYAVCTEDSNFLTRKWLNASGQTGIPVSFVINREGRIAWIGHPHYLDEVLPKILNDSLDIKKASAEYKLNKHLEFLDDSVAYELQDYKAEVESKYVGKSDSLLLIKINEIVRNEPELKYAPNVASYTFNVLLKMKPNEAYKYGKVLIATRTYRFPPYYVVFNSIKSYSESHILPPRLYELGAEAYQARIDFSRKTVNLPNAYHTMAEWYWRANDISNAVLTEQKAIDAWKLKTNGSRNSLDIFETRLQQYKDSASKVKNLEIH
jgi:thiol-disulfide isomerase/thioredoxin